MFNILISYPVKNFSSLLCSGLSVVGEAAMVLWDSNVDFGLNLDSETIEVPPYLLYYTTQMVGQEASWAYNVLYLGLLVSCEQKPKLSFSLIYFQLLNSSWVYNMLMTSATFKTLIAQVPNPNIFAARRRCMLCREEANKTFALHSEFRISI